MNCPPFTVIVEPIIKLASVEERKITHHAISSGSPDLPTGIWETVLSIKFSGIDFNISVWIYPGQIELSVILFAAP